ncbi:nicotinate phosphoribosyltransferase [Neolewinella sp.]|uniref:nicotinate phosphoribosyltransferase n=1 Tax=Neolewinella sp. TaxID=2993543 RepID=UPI003B51E7F3
MSPTPPLAQVYRPNFGLLTDLYQLTMAAAYHHQGMQERRAVFHLFFRKAPFGERAAIAAGLPLAIEIVKGLSFSADDVQYLGRLKGANGKPLFREPFLNYLQRLTFTGDIDAIPEGEIALPHEPLLRVEAPLIQAQLLETALLNVINFSTLIATKAARIKAAAGEDRVIEFGLRRAQGIDGGLTASRSAYVGGCDGTSNVWAGRYYDVPVRGTHAHSWVMAHADELTAFESYAEALPNNCIFLVDTYDTIEGVRNAIRVGQQLRERGHELRGIRLDSGDLADLSIRARRMLDEAGFPDAFVSASDSLDEYAIERLKTAGARITVWGIGTRLATAYDQPALGGVYKLAAIQNEAGEWEPKIKRSETLIKVSNPGRLAVRRYYAGDRPLASQLYDTLGEAPSAQVMDESLQRHELKGEAVELLEPIFRNGQAIDRPYDIHRTRARALENWRQWHAADMDTFVYGLAPELLREKEALLEA